MKLIKKLRLSYFLRINWARCFWNNILPIYICTGEHLLLIALAWLWGLVYCWMWSAGENQSSRGFGFLLVELVFANTEGLAVLWFAELCSAEGKAAATDLLHTGEVLKHHLRQDPHCQGSVKTRCLNPSKAADYWAETLSSGKLLVCQASLIFSLDFNVNSFILNWCW